MITIEYDEKYEVTIIVDDAGAIELSELFNDLAHHKETHFHLMTPSFAGNELSESKFNKNNTLINMLRLQIIP